MEKPDKALLISLLTFLVALLDKQCQAFGGRVVALICDTPDGTSTILSPSLNEAEVKIITEKISPAVREAAREVEALNKQKSRPLM